MRKIVEVKNASKTFTIREKGKRSIKDSILRFYKQKGDIRYIQALENINFSVYEKDFIGVLGRNGSGKSTLLRMIIGALKGNKGTIISTKGKIIRLALGLGFDGNLSARDNIYMNGSVLGLSFKQIGTVFDDIITFAELENFVETPVKHYSSGMISRLKFSIAIHAEADIFLMDEFFGGVGDIGFQHKSNQVFKDRFLDNRTIIFVSHNIGLLKRLCNKILFLDKGKQIAFGPTDEIILLYQQMFAAEIEARKKLRLAKRKERIARRNNNLKN